MKFKSSTAFSAVAAILLSLCTAAAAQTTSAPNAPVPHPLHAVQSGPGQLLFSRSLTHPGKAQRPSPSPQVPKATNQERRALTITSYHLDIHLTPRDQSISAEARMTFRNSSHQPLHEIALQVSSSLQFQGIGQHGQKLTYAQHSIASGTDHTGRLTEADILLPTPLAPGASMSIQVFYGGKIPVSGKRLEALGAPKTVADASDWDRISQGFTALRGFGSVVWYPVSSVPVAMGDGNRLFEEIARQKQREGNATVSMNVTVAYFDQPPNLAILDGRLIPVGPPSAQPTASFPGIVTISLPAQKIGFQQLSLVLAHRQVSQKDHVKIFARPSDSKDAKTWLQAAAQVTPLIQKWLGSKPDSPLAIVDLPESDDAPSQVGAALLTPLNQTSSGSLTTALVHALAHAYFRSPRGWLNEGVPSFMVSLWIETRHGRKTALEYLEGQRGALAIAEPASPGSSFGQPLISAYAPVYVRTKSSYVFWMLRHLAGDQAIQSALQHYAPAKDSTPDYFEKLIEHACGKNLHWFFQDWVYQDPGLPDLSVTNVYPNKVGLGETLVAITITNHGYASASVPVTLVSPATKVTNYVRVPANSSVTHRMEIPGNPTQITVNNGTVPEVAASIHTITLKGRSSSN